MNKIIFKSMSIALAASDKLNLHGIISRPVKRGTRKCGCCVELVIYRGALDEAIRTLNTYGYQYEMSE